MTRAVPQPDFWQRRPARRTPPPIERRTHIALADLLRLRRAAGLVVVAIFRSANYRSEKTGALLKRMGTQRGMLDFLLISPTGEHHWLELKRGSAPLTEAQQAFIEQLHRAACPGSSRATTTPLSSNSRNGACC